MEERRNYKRLPVSFPVEFTTLPSRQYFYTVTKDLSLGGVKIISDTFLAKDAPFKLNVNLINKVIGLEAKVSWCNAQQRQQRYSAGLEFKNINQVDRKELSRFIESIDNS